MTEFIDVPINRIFLCLDNPRHEPMEDEAQAIEYLCKEEDVYPLARDIAKFGLNPLERFALVAEVGKSGARQSYSVPEGNRRMCAIKLLNDPDLAPPSLRKSFEKLSQTWTPITEVPAVVFDTKEDVWHWLDRIHMGPQGGIGRKSWNPEQKSRYDGGNKNKAAQAFLDYAQAEGMITAEQRKDKLTTTQRFLSNTTFREALGFDQSNPDIVGRTRPKEEFDLLARKFVEDLIGNKNVTSRMNKNQIIIYARQIGALPGVTNTRVTTETLTSEPIDSKGPSRRRKTPKTPEKAKKVTYEDAISRALEGLGNEKLQSLYYSICSIELEKHTPIVSVGVWSFFESLTACAGRIEGVSFDSFLSKAKLTSYSLGGDSKSMMEAIARIRAYGNTTKHHKVSATFNGDQLNNDMTALKDVILKCIEEAVQKAT
ncbi:hypothetical protein [Novispirillum itersonii]|uniref:hypothetical protein n=1 Tax=Novispirillum itersonii TaxID=189 RepID=UPI00036B84FD|nr:hypothetical protein [Novispirillum itersonii]